MDTARLLMEARADPSHANHYGYAVFEVACSAGATNVVKLLATEEAVAGTEKLLVEASYSSRGYKNRLSMLNFKWTDVQEP